MSFIDTIKRWWSMDIPTTKVDVEVWQLDPQPDITAYELYLCQNAVVLPIGFGSANAWKNEVHNRYNKLPEHCRLHMKLITRTCIEEKII